MPEKSFQIWLNDKVYVAVQFVTVRGEVAWFVVRLMVSLPSGDRCLARFDTSHGKPHLDIVDANGRLVYKEWLLGMTIEEGLQYALREFKRNHENYIRGFDA